MAGQGTLIAVTESMTRPIMTRATIVGGIVVEEATIRPTTMRWIIAEALSPEMIAEAFSLAMIADGTTVDAVIKN
jgi:hypothetical protein